MRVLAAGDQALLEVEDSGPGILPVTSANGCSTASYRVLGTVSDGSGLGLAIVREIKALASVLINDHPNPHSPKPYAHQRGVPLYTDTPGFARKLGSHPLRADINLSAARAVVTNSFNFKIQVSARTSSGLRLNVA